MKKILSLVLVVAMVLGCIGITACGGGGEGEAPPSEEEEEAPPSEEEEEAPPSEEEEEPPSGEDLSEILGRGAGITSVKYDMVVTAPGMGTVTTHCWVEGNKMRAEMDQQGQTMIYLIDYDEGVMYLYMPDQNMAMQISFDQATPSALEETQAIADYSPHIVGTETMDGKVCLVAEYTIGQASVKMWIWEEHGFPIRIESTAPEGKTITEFKNIDFSDIPDSMFELPAGVEIMEL